MSNRFERFACGLPTAASVSAHSHQSLLTATPVSSYRCTSWPLQASPTDSQADCTRTEKGRLDLTLNLPHHQPFIRWHVHKIFAPAVNLLSHAKPVSRGSAQPAAAGKPPPDVVNRGISEAHMHDVSAPNGFYELLSDPWLLSINGQGLELATRTAGQLSHSGDEHSSRR